LDFLEKEKYLTLQNSFEEDSYSIQKISHTEIHAERGTFPIPHPHWEGPSNL